MDGVGSNRSGVSRVCARVVVGVCARRACLLYAPCLASARRSCRRRGALHSQTKKHTMHTRPRPPKAKQKLDRRRVSRLKADRTARTSRSGSALAARARRVTPKSWPQKHTPATAHTTQPPAFFASAPPHRHRQTVQSQGQSNSIRISSVRRATHRVVVGRAAHTTICLSAAKRARAARRARGGQHAYGADAVIGEAAAVEAVT